MKTRNRRWLALVLALMMTFSLLLTACQPKEPTKTDPITTTTGTGEKEPSGQTDPKEPEERIFVDSVGREVKLPANLERIAPSGSLAQIVLYTACPDRLCGLSRKLSEREKQLFDPKYAELPGFGQFYGSKSNFNLEAVLAANTQAIIDIGEAKKTMKEDMDNMQSQINVPTVFIEATIEKMPQAYRDLGKLLNETERTEQLAKFCEETLALCSKAKKEVSEDKRVKVYWAMGEIGLNTNAVGSFQGEALDFLPVINVADVEVSSKGGGSEVSMEQIIQWAPDYVLVSNAKLAEAMKNDPAWSALPAVKDGKMIVIPSIPYGFLGSPPSVNRYLGIRWLGAKLFPQIFEKDPKAEVRDFYELFYHIKLDDATLDAILNDSFK